MGTAADYVRMAKCLDDRGLRSLWTAIQHGNTPDWPPGKAFEYFVLRAFELDGAKVRWPYQVHLENEVIEQIDGVAHVGSIAALFEVKDRQARLNVEPLAKLRNQLLRRPAGTIGVVFSRAGFTEPAQILAGYMAPTTILLWEGTEISLALDSGVVNPFVRGLQWKYRLAVEEGVVAANLAAFLTDLRS